MLSHLLLQKIVDAKAVSAAGLPEELLADTFEVMAQLLENPREHLPTQSLNVLREFARTSITPWREVVVVPEPGGTGSRRRRKEMTDST